MKKIIFILISCSFMALAACTNNQNYTNDILIENYQTVESYYENVQKSSLNFFNPGYAEFYDMVEASAVIVHGRVLNERVEWVNTHITLEEAIERRIEEYENGLISRESRDAQIAHHEENANDFEPQYDYVIFYDIEILESFQGAHGLGDTIQLFTFMGRDEHWNPVLEFSRRYEIDTEFILFLRDGGRLGYFVLNPRQAVYEVPIDLGINQYIGLILDYVEEFQIPYIEIDGSMVSTSGALYEPFEISFKTLRDLSSESSQRRREARRNRQNSSRNFVSGIEITEHLYVTAYDNELDVLWINILNNGFDTINTNFDFTLEMYRDGQWMALSPQNDPPNFEILSIFAQDYSTVGLTMQNFPILLNGRYRLTLPIFNLSENFEFLNPREIVAEFHIFN